MIVGIIVILQVGKTPFTIYYREFFVSSGTTKIIGKVYDNVNILLREYKKLQTHVWMVQRSLKFVSLSRLVHNNILSFILYCMQFQPRENDYTLPALTTFVNHNL